MSVGCFMLEQDVMFLLSSSSSTVCIVCVLQYLNIQAASSSKQRLREVEQLGAPGRVQAGQTRDETGTGKHIWTGQVQALDIRVSQPISRPRPATALPLQHISLLAGSFLMLRNRTQELNQQRDSHSAAHCPSACPPCTGRWPDPLLRPDSVQSDHNKHRPVCFCSFSSFTSGPGSSAWTHTTNLTLFLLRSSSRVTNSCPRMRTTRKPRYWGGRVRAQSRV